MLFIGIILLITILNCIYFISNPNKLYPERSIQPPKMNILQMVLANCMPFYRRSLYPKFTKEQLEKTGRDLMADTLKSALFSAGLILSIIFICSSI